MMDAMVALTSNPTDLIRVRYNCNDERADELIDELMGRVSLPHFNFHFETRN